MLGKGVSCLHSGEFSPVPREQEEVVQPARQESARSSGEKKLAWDRGELLAKVDKAGMERPVVWLSQYAQLDARASECELPFTNPTTQ